MPLADQRPSGPRAFAGAIGYGARSKGGRGGAVVAVTTLADAGPGSLRACVERDGPRTCVFRVSGVIRFTQRPPVIRNPYLTIAGETAPGGGITLAHGGGPDGRTPLLIKDTHDIVVRHVRIRNDRIGGERGSEDSITIENSNWVIIDHVSASWARDELINGYGDNDYITISNSIFSWGIPKHDKCALLGSDPTRPEHFSFIGNLCAFNGDRNPDINFSPGSCVEVLNNVFYDAQSEFAEVWESYGGTPVSIIGNFFKAGPNTTSHAVGIVRQVTGSRGLGSIYMTDNTFDGDFEHITTLAQGIARTSIPCPLTIAPVTAAQATAHVLQTAGAWPRDDLDREVVADVQNRRGRIVQEPGVIPPIAEGTPFPDRDNDGMDDRWEVAHGANPAKADPWTDADSDGISNLDAFLDDLDSRATK
ncbi:pectate lyase family protein [Novosphingobium lentum]|uniref:pectate lyase family protein n=1 Tax=Novosphingobium lentum TaxID=145287 RepID=UPI000829D0CE|nr:pectate lyase [Novosphingobium lentum]